MRKRISVCMLAAMMSVTSMYSFVAQGAENETEQETGIEQESETQAEEAVDVSSSHTLLFFYILVQKQYDTYNSISYVLNCLYPFG